MAAYDDILGALDDALMSGDEVMLGDEDAMGEDELGAPRRRAPVRNKAGNLARRGVPKLAAPGVQQRGQKRLVMPLGSITFLPAGATTQELTRRPQKAIRVERIIAVRSNVGVASPALTVNMNDLKVGNDSQFLAPGGVPVEVFGPTVQNIDLRGDTAAPGLDLWTSLTISAAPAAAESVTIALAVVGEAIA